MLKAETETERRLVGLVGALMAMAPDLLKVALKAAELDGEELDALVKRSAGEDPGRSFSCTMWNVMNNTIGAEMLSHEEILLKMERKPDASDLP